MILSFTILKPDYNQGCPVEGVLFDMDGLLLDTEKLYCRYWQEAANALGYPMTHRQALGMRALNSSAGEAKLKSYFGPQIDYRSVRQIRIQRMDAHIDRFGVEPKPGIPELLSYLKDRKIRTAIASSSPVERIRRFMDPLGFTGLFDALCSGYDVPNGKPEPDIFLRAAGEIGIAPERCMVLEDSPSGLLAGSRAGCYPVMIPDQDQPDPDTLALLYAKADSLTDIIGLLDAIHPEPRQNGGIFHVPNHRGHL